MTYLWCILPPIIKPYTSLSANIMELDSVADTQSFSVTIVGFDGALASSITGAIDMFALAGVAMERIYQKPINRLFSVQLAALDVGPIHCINNNMLFAQKRLSEVSNSDIVLIPTIGGDIPSILQQTRGLLPDIIRLYNQGSDLASNCTGAFLLANAGLLDHKTATTHWGYADAFSTLFPKVNLQAQQLITQDQQLFCAGGGMAWYDLVLRLIERYAGHRTAADTAKSHVIDFARGQQSLYAPLNRRKFHHDKEILLLQDWLENNYAVTNSIADMAEVCSLTPRTLNRRFKRATGQTPQTYLQALRIEQAKKLLENTELPISEIVNKVGYDDVSSFARLFKKLTSLSPGYYRSSFRN